MSEDNDQINIEDLKNKKELRKHLDERLQTLYRRTAVIEDQLINLEDKRFYRVCIFGSARLKSDTAEYKHVQEVARLLSKEGIDILTGGGPGLMDAANKGALIGRQQGGSKSRSLGITIQLSFEPEANKHLDIKRHHQKFSSRLDDFMRLSHSVIVTPGGIGTLLELYFTWQLIQVKHISSRPIVMLDSAFWQGLIEWMKKSPLDRKLLNVEDFNSLQTVDTPEQVATIILKHYEEHKKLNRIL